MLQSLADWVGAHIHLWPWLVAAVVVLMVVWALAHRPRPRDPQRLFSSTQRAEGNARAGGRCEQTVWWVLRCRRPAQHGDHWLPWSKGGSTTMENYAALCAPCNLRKSAHTPSWWATHRLQRRRRRYFPEGVPVQAGAKYRP